MFTACTMRSSFAGLGLALLLTAVTPANAAILAPGTEVAIENRTVTSLGTFLNIFEDVPFSSIPDADFTGEFTQVAYREADSSITLYYQFLNNASSDVAISRFSAGNFGGVNIDAYVLASDSTLPQGFSSFGTNAPSEFDRGSAGNGLSVGFDYEENANDRLQPGQLSRILVLNTNATTLSAGSVSGLDGGDAFGAVAYDVTGPFTDIVVPEPGTYALMGAGLIGLVVAHRRRSQKA